MEKQMPVFSIGDRVIHWSYGPGVILQIDEKEIGGEILQYYVVLAGELSLWVPVQDGGEPCLRQLTPAEEFPHLFTILSSDGETLSDNVMERKRVLRERMRAGNLESICTVLRDLTHHKRVGKMTEYDRGLLEQTKKLLLQEWSLVLSVPLDQAEQELCTLLEVSCADLG